MNARKIIYGIIIVCLCIGGSFCIGFNYHDKTTISRLETDITELSKRNKSITTRINDLSEASRRDAEASRLLAEGIAELNKGLIEQVKRSRAIADRAQRIDYLARVLDKGISDLILKVDNIQEGNNSSNSSSSN